MFLQTVANVFIYSLRTSYFYLCILILISIPEPFSSTQRTGFESLLFLLNSLAHWEHGGENDAAGSILPTPLGLTSPETDFCRCVCLSPVCPSRSHCGKGAGQRLFLLSWSYPTRFMFQAPPPCCAVSSRCARLFFTLLLQVLSA